MAYSDLFIQRIASLCKNRKLSINKLANMSGVKQSTLDNIMQGNTQNPGIKTIHQIANAFSMTPAEFLDFKELNDYSFADQSEE